MSTAADAFLFDDLSDRVLLEIVVAGHPVGAARPRIVRRPDGGVHTVMPDKSVAWEEHARQLIAGAWLAVDAFRPPFPGLVLVDLLALQHRPGRLGGPVKKRGQTMPRDRFPAGQKPDIDNVLKLGMDSLVKAGVLVDDTRVAEVRARRLWTAIDNDGNPVEVERVELRVLDLRIPF